ncbi:MAG: hypothetical protein NTW60_00040 [Candidatus Wolfebacteria bacterium]|nr:hypothetical protein [Candidatus Wolfebacteria bacterium]
MIIDNSPVRRELARLGHLVVVAESYLCPAGWTRIALPDSVKTPAAAAVYPEITPTKEWTPIEKAIQYIKESRGEVDLVVIPMDRKMKWSFINLLGAINKMAKDGLFLGHTPKVFLVQGESFRKDAEQLARELGIVVLPSEFSEGGEADIETLGGLIDRNFAGFMRFRRDLVREEEGGWPCR